VPLSQLRADISRDLDQNHESFQKEMLRPDEVGIADSKIAILDHSIKTNDSDIWKVAWQTPSSLPTLVLKTLAFMFYQD
jgi:hypothetical protein